jgi:hypothetical protein
LTAATAARIIDAGPFGTPKMRVHSFAPVCAILVLSACASSSPPVVDVPTAQAAVCAPGVSLGKVVVAPLTRWRADQKEPEVREAIAMKAIESAFLNSPCAAGVRVLPIAPDDLSGARLAQARTEGATTAILVRIDELGPIAVLSFPVLWSTWSDVQFTLDVVDAATGEVLRTIPHRRQKGGAFEMRGLEPLQAEMELALRDVILGVAPVH